MSAGLSEQRLLEHLVRAHRHWEALLAEIGIHRLEWIGVTPDWVRRTRKLISNGL
jgi:hypothetical protein